MIEEKKSNQAIKQEREGKRPVLVLVLKCVCVCVCVC